MRNAAESDHPRRRKSEARASFCRSRVRCKCLHAAKSDHVQTVALVCLSRSEALAQIPNQVLKYSFYPFPPVTPGRFTFIRNLRNLSELSSENSPPLKVCSCAYHITSPTYPRRLLRHRLRPVFQVVPNLVTVPEVFGLPRHSWTIPRPKQSSCAFPDPGVSKPLIGRAVRLLAVLNFILTTTEQGGLLIFTIILPSLPCPSIFQPMMNSRGDYSFRRTMQETNSLACLISIAGMLPHSRRPRG